MLSSVRVQNYRCLRDVTLELGPLTVFVGPNASGKTAIADCLTAIKSPTINDFWKKSQHSKPKWIQGSHARHDPTVLGVHRKKYALELHKLRQAQTANEAWSLESSGSNLANLFDTLTRSEQDRFVDEFTRLVPMYADIKARAKNGQKGLQFQDRWSPSLWYEPDQVSDGTMLTAALVALGFQRDPPNLAVIEDPDQGLHPYLQRHIAEMLRKLAAGELGAKPIQIVCTTHSRSFLDFLEPEEVRFITRSRETGETEIRKAPTDNPNWKQVYDRFQSSLGNMWMTGSLGGVPGG